MSNPTHDQPNVNSVRTAALAKVIEHLVELDYSFRSYRGRGYTAPTCVGMTTDDVYDSAWSLSRDLAELHADGHLTEEEYAHASQVFAFARRDSLGLQTILYWELIPWTWDQPTLGVCEEDDEEEDASA